MIVAVVENAPVPVNDATDAALHQFVLATSNGRIESRGRDKPDEFSCDYCGGVYESHDLEDVGMGALMCRVCREQVDVATKSGVFTFWELLDFRLLASVGSSSGAPVAAGVCLAPFSGLTHPGGKPWWRRQSFWDRDKRMGDDLPNGLRYCVDRLLGRHPESAISKECVRCYREAVYNETPCPRHRKTDGDDLP